VHAEDDEQQPAADGHRALGDARRHVPPADHGGARAHHVVALQVEFGKAKF
jgi:hypothetical protein